MRGRAGRRRQARVTRCLGVITDATLIGGPAGGAGGRPSRSEPPGQRSGLEAATACERLTGRSSASSPRPPFTPRPRRTRTPSAATAPATWGSNATAVQPARRTACRDLVVLQHDESVRRRTAVQPALLPDGVVRNRAAGQLRHRGRHLRVRRLLRRRCHRPRPDVLPAGGLLLRRDGELDGRPVVFPERLSRRERRYPRHQCRVRPGGTCARSSSDPPTRDHADPRGGPLVRRGRVSAT
jgi:hypothetical protein